ncbi:NACHT domain-containing protein [Leptolyngbyaceae cyanobacterium CCMR0082]|uniref:NACHT domain-containing protein n=1 Tax=Adonisia turfae CCMR0082 TaxID=2304604 RepID=A0A6M0S5C3_9CYAN|nr:NACHT domain-containing protein [Adonisia turfae]NEZ63550.1 NACHT domain-containing protein [Adonisia turfae CCMR0082]
MPKISYGPVAKQRTLTLLMALVDYGNDELEVDDVALERLRSQLNLHWTTDRQLIVRTKIRNLETLTHLSDSNQALTKAQIKTALHHLENHLELLEDNRTSRRGSEMWHFTLTLWHHRRDRTALLNTFDHTWEQRRSVPTESQAEKPAEHDIWQQYCQQALAATVQTGLTSNLLKPTDTGVDPTKLHIPLALVDHTLEQSTKQPSDIETINTAELLTYLQNSTVQTLAIVGEPGSGKTTLLQQLAQQILQQTSDLAILIPLARLGTTLIEDYVLKDWLKLALNQRAVPPEQQNALAEHIEQGHSWLLLDAVDEMDQHGSLAITQLANQLQGWLSNGRIIVTCRLNLWDAGKNTLGHWPTYRLLGYEKYRQQIQHFIRQWFSHQPEQGKALCQKLSLPENKRLRHNLRNPLRLALLCRLGNSGHLPNTQHQLYQQFVTALYDWQQDTSPTTLLEQHQINTVLSKLAVVTLKASTTQLNLPLVTQHLQAEELPWFERAMQLGWLMPLATSTGEKVYGFLHGTFRDYFAAQAIEEWQYFTTPKDAQLPMVLPNWQPVILLWLGRSDIENADKTALINALLDFQDNCGGFFEHRTWLLAGRALGEYSEFPKAYGIIQQLITWRFNLTRKISPILIEAAKAALAESDLSQVTQVLTQFAQDPNQDFFDRWMAAYSLGRSYDPQSQVAVETLEALLPTARSDYLKMDMARHLGTLSPGHGLAIETLEEIIHRSQQPIAKRKAALRLAKVAPHHPLPVATLEDLLAHNPQDKPTLDALVNLNPNHPVPINRESSSQSPRRLQHRSGKKQQYQPDIAKQIDSLVTRIEKGDRNRLRLAQKLSQLQAGHPIAINTLWQYLITSENKTQRKQAGNALQRAATDAQLPQLVSKLRLIYEQATIAENKDQQLAFFKLLWTWSDTLGYLDFLAAWQGTETEL